MDFSHLIEVFPGSRKYNKKGIQNIVFIMENDQTKQLILS